MSSIDVAAQVRQMLRYESVITAVIGGVLGIAVGLLLAFLVTRSLGDLGRTTTEPFGGSVPMSVTGPRTTIAAWLKRT